MDNIADNIIAQVELIRLDLLDDDPRNERANLAQDLEELTASVHENGIRTPLTVFRKPDGRYQIVKGHRRKAAALAAGFPVEAPCIVVPAPATQFEGDFDRLLDNLLRQDLTPVELAHGYRALLDANPDLTQAELARRLGISQPKIANTLRLLTLPAAVLEHIAAGQLSAGHGVALLAVAEGDELTWDGKRVGDRAGAIARLARTALDHNYSVRALESVVANYNSSRQWAETRRQQEQRRTAALAEQAEAGDEEARAAVNRQEARDAYFAWEKLANKRNGQRKRPRLALALRTARQAVAWDPAQGPTLAHLKLAAFQLSNDRYSGGRTPHGFPPREKMEQYIHDAAGQPAVLNLIALLAIEILTPSEYNDDGLLHVGYSAPMKFAEETWQINPKIQAAVAAEDLAAEKARYGELPPPPRFVPEGLHKKVKGWNSEIAAGVQAVLRATVPPDPEQEAARAQRQAEAQAFWADKPAGMTLVEWVALKEGLPVDGASGELTGDGYNDADLVIEQAVAIAAN